MNSTISDWTTSTMSIGVPVVICMLTAPARKAPKSRPAKKVPHGVERPSSATVMASKPSEPATPAVSTFSVPATCATPAAPASAPAKAMARMVERATFTPAVRAASGLCPTARNSKPMVERFSSQATPMVSKMAIRKPRCRREPGSEGKIALASRIGEIGLVSPGRRNASVFIRKSSRYSAT